MATAKVKSKADIEWEQRTLCSDESCIGTIGKDGVCRECGKKYEGTLPDFVNVEPESQNGGDAIKEDPAGELTEPAVATPPDTGDTVADNADDEWENRILCSDESCIGVIGPDNCCKECGKPYEKTN